MTQRSDVSPATSSAGSGEDPRGAVLRVPGARSRALALHKDAEGRWVLPKGATVTLVEDTSKNRRRPARPVKESIRLKADGAGAYGSVATITRLLDVLGSNAIADLLDVAKDRPGRWAKGDGLDASNRARLSELDALVGQLLAVFTPEQATLWLAGDNAHLGARPVDVFRLQGSTPLIEAIGAHAQGAFA